MVQVASPQFIFASDWLPLANFSHLVPFRPQDRQSECWSVAGRNQPFLSHDPPRLEGGVNPVYLLGSWAFVTGLPVGATIWGRSVCRFGDSQHVDVTSPWECPHVANLSAPLGRQQMSKVARPSGLSETRGLFTLGFAVIVGSGALQAVPLALLHRRPLVKL